MDVYSLAPELPSPLRIHGTPIASKFLLSLQLDHQTGTSPDTDKDLLG